MLKRGLMQDMVLFAPDKGMSLLEIVSRGCFTTCSSVLFASEQTRLLLFLRLSTAITTRRD